MAEFPHTVSEALLLLNEELIKQTPCVARSSVAMGVLQERLLTQSGGEGSLQIEVMSYMDKFQQLLVQPAAAKLGKCRKTQDKVVAIAKFLRAKLAKAPAHKQPLHTQYLPSALRDNGKRQLDCLGIATAVLALCHQISQQQPSQHADLASSSMVVSDDHCWLSLPAADGGADLQIEVTVPRVLQPTHTANWLYAGGDGTACSAANVVMTLVAGMMPEELKDDAAADHIRSVQLHLMQQLAHQHPQAMFYSNYYCWGMLHEEHELEQLALAAESGNMQTLQQLALLGPDQLQSQQCYQQSKQRSSGWQWHPSSCAAFGWLNRIQAALCGNTDNLLALQPTADAAAGSSNAALKQQPDGRSQYCQLQQVTAGSWLNISTFLLQQALLSVQDCTQVLRKYSGCASKPDKAADQQLMEAVRDLWQNLADACKAVACLQQLQEHEAKQQQRVQEHKAMQIPQKVEQVQNDVARKAAGMTLVNAHVNSSAGMHSDQQGEEQLGIGGHAAADVPAAAPVTGHTVHLAAAISKANLQLQLTEQLTTNSWLQTQLCFMDALCAYYGDESADLPADTVAYCLEAAGTFSCTTRASTVAEVAGQLQSSRLRALAEAASVHGCAWQGMGPELQQLVQLPSSRKRKRKEF